MGAIGILNQEQRDKIVELRDKKGLSYRRIARILVGEGASITFQRVYQLYNTETRQRLIAKMSGDGEPSAHPSDEAVCKQGVAEGNPLPEATPPAETNETVSNSTGTAPDHQLGRGEAPVRLSKCLVEFCRDKCPILPEDVEVIRASGQVRCPECNRKYLVHPTYAYSSGMGHVVRSCDGKFLHL